MMILFYWGDDKKCLPEDKADKYQNGLK